MHNDDLIWDINILTNQLLSNAFILTIHPYNVGLEKTSLFHPPLDSQTGFHLQQEILIDSSDSGVNFSHPLCT